MVHELLHHLPAGFRTTSPEKKKNTVHTCTEALIASTIFYCISKFVT